MTTRWADWACTATGDEYYSVLERTSARSIDITALLVWFLEQVEAAIFSSEPVVNTVLRKAQFWIAHSRDELNERHVKALNRILDAGPESFVGGMTNEKYRHLTGSRPATAQRDLADLLEKGCFVLAGRGRSAYYELATGVAFKSG